MHAAGVAKQSVSFSELVTVEARASLPQPSVLMSLQCIGWMGRLQGDSVSNPTPEPRSKANEGTEDVKGRMDGPTHVLASSSNSSSWSLRQALS